MTASEIVLLRANPPWGLELIVERLCDAILAAHDGAPLPPRFLARLLGFASSWSHVDPGVIAQLVEELKRVNARNLERLL